MNIDNSKMKTTNIKGKDYVEVKERILALANSGEKYSIETEYEYISERKMWIVKAKLSYNDCIYNGLAQEIESEDYKQVNFASALENCETSAVGRACAMAGIGVLDSIASVDEITKANNRGSQFNQNKDITKEVLSGKHAGDNWFNDSDIGILQDKLGDGELTVETAPEYLNTTYSISKINAEKLNKWLQIYKNNLGSND